MLKKYRSIVLASLMMGTSTLLYASAAGSDKGIAGIANSVSSNLNAVAQLISQVAFVAGLGFFVSAVFKFKQHKDNPTQVPIGTPMSMLAISAALMFMGNFIMPLGQTLFSSANPGSSATDLTKGLGAGS